MKNFVAALSLGVLLMTGAALADTAVPTGNPQADSAPAASRETRKQEFEARMMTRLKARLDLTDDQAQKLHSIFQSWQDQEKQRRTDFQSKFRGVLTAEQQGKIDQMKQRREQWRKEHAAKGDWKKKDENKARRDKRTADKKKRDHKEKATAHEHRHRLDLNLSADQQRQLHALANQERHLRKADREQMLAQTSAVLSPLQEHQFERDMKQWDCHSRHHGHGSHGHHWKSHDRDGHHEHGDVHSDRDQDDAIAPDMAD